MFAFLDSPNAHPQSKLGALVGERPHNPMAICRIDPRRCRTIRSEAYRRYSHSRSQLYIVAGLCQGAARRIDHFGSVDMWRHSYIGSIS